MRGASNLHVCQTTPGVTEVVPTGPCAGDDRHGAPPCRGKAKWSLGGVNRCAHHTASVLHDLPVGGGR